MVVNILLVMAIVALCATVPLVCILLCQEIRYKSLRTEYYKRALDEVKSMEDWVTRSLSCTSNDSESKFSFFFNDDDDKQIH